MNDVINSIVNWIEYDFFQAQANFSLNSKHSPSFQHQLAQRIQCKIEYRYLLAFLKTSNLTVIQPALSDYSNKSYIINVLISKSRIHFNFQIIQLSNHINGTVLKIFSIFISPKHLKNMFPLLN